MDRRLAIVVAFYVALAGGGLLWMVWRGDPFPAALVGTEVSWPVSLVSGIGAAVVVVALCDRVLDRFQWTERLRRDVVEMLGPMTAPRAVTLAVASGVGEELLFRGGLLPWAGLIVSSVVFGALHIGPRLVGWTLFAIAAGFVFGALAVWTGGVLAPAVAHAGINGVQLLRLRTLDAGEDIH